jgi:hypothetical protein
MVEPMVRATTSEAGCCPHCGTPHRRLGGSPAAACGWGQDCGCPPHEPTPCTVFDPFTGAASTAIAALTLGRRFVGTEINANYVQQGHERIEAWREQREQVKRAG